MRCAKDESNQAVAMVTHLDQTILEKNQNNEIC